MLTGKGDFEPWWALMARGGLLLGKWVTFASSNRTQFDPLSQVITRIFSNPLSRGESQWVVDQRQWGTPLSESGYPTY